MPLKLCSQLVSLYVKAGKGKIIDHLRFLQGLTNLQELSLAGACMRVLRIRVRACACTCVCVRIRVMWRATCAHVSEMGCHTIAVPY